jgi:CheY-like chemotaxis protein
MIFADSQQQIGHAFCYPMPLRRCGVVPDPMLVEVDRPMTVMTGDDSPTGTAGGTPMRDHLAIAPDVAATIRLLIVDDERTLRESCASVLQGDGYQVTLASRGEEALDMVRRRPFDLILVDLFMNQVTGLQILAAALGLNPETLVVVMTGNPSVGSSIEALRAGAWDYLPKPFSATHLQVLVGRASHAVLKAREAAELRQQVLRHGDAGDGSALIGISPAFRRAVELARKVAATDASVFISGESGTGKEVIAQFIHAHSRRSRKHLVPINCAALPEPLLESEMFGHRKGAFTGADRDKPGLLETANGSTLFLDELTEMSLPLQAGGARDPAWRPLLPAPGGADCPAAAEGAGRGHFSAGQPLSDHLLGQAPADAWAAAAAHGGGAGAVALPGLARQCARTAECDRACRRAGRP